MTLYGLNIAGYICVHVDNLTLPSNTIINTIEKATVLTIVCLCN